MPAVSKKQEKFMQAVAHNPKFAKAAGVPQSVGKEFTKSGGGMATKGVNPFAKFEKSKKDVEKKGVKEGSKKDMAADKKMMPKFAKGGLAAGHKSADGVASKGKTNGDSGPSVGIQTGAKRGGKR
jgi:hypothetical protein